MLASYQLLLFLASLQVICEHLMSECVLKVGHCDAGNSGLSWSDVLLGDMPNVYVYAANNPSESILAKRRGYGTIISHNVPPYARSGPLTSYDLLRWLIWLACTHFLTTCFLCVGRREVSVWYTGVAATFVGMHDHDVPSLIDM